MYEIQTTTRVITCPWCYGPVVPIESEEECLTCPICKREIREEDVDAYNDVALEIMKEQGIMINDLNRLIKNNDPGSCILEDGVHMSEKGNVILANGVVGFLRTMISS